MSLNRFDPKDFQNHETYLAVVTFASRAQLFQAARQLLSDGCRAEMLLELLNEAEPMFWPNPKRINWQQVASTLTDEGIL